MALEIQQRYATPDEAEADMRRRVDEREVIIGFGHPVYTISDPRSDIIKEVARKLATEVGRQRLLSRWPSGLRRRCATPSACFRISTGTARWPMI